MKKLFLLLTFTILFTAFLFPQATVKLPDVTAASNTDVSIPIEVTGFNNLGAISIVINYDPNVLTYQSNPDPLTGNFILNNANGQISIGWFGLTPLTVTDGNLLHLNFKYLGGSSNLEFVTTNTNEIADASGTGIPTTYKNGSIGPLGVTQTASIGDYVWNDKNGNGIQEPATETPLENVTVKLFNATVDPNGTGTPLLTTTTNVDGNYLFSGLSAGTYKVKFELLNGYVFSPKGDGSSPDGDSDADVTTGLTDEITLAADQKLWEIDAGMYVSTPPTQTTSVGDFVWNDINDNGMQDSNEVGIKDVVVRLLDASNNDTELQSTTTDEQGKYDFNNLTAGNYRLLFVLPTDFVFSPKKANNTTNDNDSDVDPATSMTDVITLNSGGNTTINTEAYSINGGGNINYIDCGMYNPTPITSTGSIGDYVWNDLDENGIQKPKTEEPALEKVTVKLFDATVDPYGTGTPLQTTTTNVDGEYLFSGLPAGKYKVKFVLLDGYVFSPKKVDYPTSKSGDSDADLTTGLTDEITLAANQKIWGIDAGMICDPASGGGDGGVESRGDLASILLKRQLLIKYGRTTPILAKTGANAITSQHSLSEFYPQTGPFNSHGTVTTPFDILGISNAVSSYAMDYKINTATGARRVAGIFSTITAAPYIYDHTKAMCDRLGGSVVGDLKLIEVNGYKFYAAKLRNEKKYQTDYAISFSVYETPSGYQLQNKWTYGEYISPDGASSVYNFQVWSSTYESTLELVKSILSKISSFGSLTYLNVNQVEPDVFVKNSYYSHDGTIHLKIMNLGNASNLSIVNKYRISQGDVQVEKTDNITVQNGENDIVLSPGVISDANLSLTSSTGFKDEVFVSGGAFTDISGPNSTVTNFSTVNYPQPIVSNYAVGSMLLSGGVSISGTLSDWISVIRSFSASGYNIDLSDFGSIKFKAKGTGTLTLIFDLTNTQNYNYFSYSVNLTSDETEYSVNFSDLRELIPSQNQFDPSLVRNIGFILYKNSNPNLTDFNFEVSNIVFSPNVVTGIEDEQLVPKEFTLSQNYPNPFNPTTTIRFTLPEASMVTLKIYNMLGQEVKTLVNGQKNAGSFNVLWSGDNDFGQKVSSGTYIYRVIAGQNIFTKKMILLK